jgi:hypothetical protein
MNVSINVFSKNSNTVKDRNSLNITITLIESTEQNINESAGWLNDAYEGDIK